MVSAVLVDAINNPSAALLELYDSAGEDHNFAARVSAHFSDIFSSLDAFHQIPSLNVKNPPHAFENRSLVRFRGMVQDTPSSPEMYLSRFAGNKCGGWGLSGDHYQSRDIDYGDLRECNPFWIVSVPGETDWRAKELDGEDANASSNTQYQPSRTHKSPFPDLPSLGVNVKIYEKSSAQSLKPTDVATFVGILTSETIISGDAADTTEVPTLHVLFTRPHTSTLLPYSFPASDDTMYDDLVDWIAEEGLGADRDAAEWVLFACVARVNSRRPALLPPPLALTRFPSPKSTSTTPTLFWILSKLLPLSLILPLSLDMLNKEAFVPESTDEDLHSGFLQIPSGTVVLVTENGVQEGLLGEKGITNLRAIQGVMSSQTVEYVFPFSRFSFDTEINFIVLSEGKRSAFFETEITAAIDVPESQWDGLYKSKDDIRMPCQEKLDAFRQLVGGARSGVKLKVGDAMSQHIENEFVQERKEDETVSQSDLVMRMTIAKLLAMVLHREELTVDVWERAKKLDERRKNRLRLQQT